MAICQKETYEEVLELASKREDFESLILLQVLAQVNGEIDGEKRAKRIVKILNKAQKVFGEDSPILIELVDYFQVAFRKNIPNAGSFYKGE